MPDGLVFCKARYGDGANQGKLNVPIGADIDRCPARLTTASAPDAVPRQVAGSTRAPPHVDVHHIAHADGVAPTWPNRGCNAARVSASRRVRWMP